MRGGEAPDTVSRVRGRATQLCDLQVGSPEVMGSAIIHVGGRVEAHVRSDFLVPCDYNYRSDMTAVDGFLGGSFVPALSNS